jgi:hypothetical protein
VRIGCSSCFKALFEVSGSGADSSLGVEKVADRDMSCVGFAARLGAFGFHFLCMQCVHASIFASTKFSAQKFLMRS